MDIPETVSWQKDEDLTTWCPSNGENAGRMIPLAVDEWKVECQAVGRWWHGGSTVLADYSRS